MSGCEMNPHTGECPLCLPGAACAALQGVFTLANDPPKPTPWRAENNRAKQMALLSGLDCLPGQEDLFCDLDKREP